MGAPLGNCNACHDRHNNNPIKGWYKRSGSKSYLFAYPRKRVYGPSHYRKGWYSKGKNWAALKYM